MNQEKTDRAIEAARNRILSFYTEYAYPIVPTDEYGNELDYEPGCVPWVVCSGIAIRSSELDEVDAEYFTVNIYADMDWREEDGEVSRISNVWFQVWVPVNGEGELDFERLSFGEALEEDDRA